MSRAQFEEKSYEIAYATELSLGIGAGSMVYSPGQVLEHILGFDAAADPQQHHVIWSVLTAPRPPGVVLSPRFFGFALPGPAGPQPLPRSPLSVILQFKRPDYLAGTRAKQWALWREPYFRFERDMRQHVVLTRLERRLQGSALVRYAAPAFHLYDELEAAQLSKTVIARSGHVSPLALGRHRVWTYLEPGIKGKANPSGITIEFESFHSALETVLDEPALRGGTLVPTRTHTATLESHLSQLAAACRDRQPTLRRQVDVWARGLFALDIQDGMREALRDYASIQSLIGQIGAFWWLIAR